MDFRTVRVCGSLGERRQGQAEAPFEPPFAPDELGLLLLQFTRPRRVARWLETPKMER